jgi:hypothetical protein
MAYLKTIARRNCILLARFKVHLDGAIFVAHCMQFLLLQHIASSKLKIAATEIACNTLRGRCYCLYFCNKIAAISHLIGC